MKEGRMDLLEYTIVRVIIAYLVLASAIGLVWLPLNKYLYYEERITFYSGKYFAPYSLLAKMRIVLVFSLVFMLLVYVCIAWFSPVGFGVLAVLSLGLLSSVFTLLIEYVLHATKNRKFHSTLGVILTLISLALSLCLALLIIRLFEIVIVHVRTFL